MNTIVEAMVVIFGVVFLIVAVSMLLAPPVMWLWKALELRRS